MHDPVDPVNPTGLYKPLTDAELEKVSPINIPVGLLYLAGLLLSVAGLTLAPDRLPTFLMTGGVAAFLLAYQGLYRRAKGLHRRVAALSSSLRAALITRGYR